MTRSRARPLSPVARLRAHSHGNAGGSLGAQAALMWLLLALVLFDGVYLAEIVRAGIQAIPTGQLQAAQALGMSRWQSMRYVVLPQALRYMLPSLVNQFVSTIKETSLGYIIGLAELSQIATQINTMVFIMPMQIYLILGLTYFLLCFGLSRLAFYLERRLATGRKTSRRPVPQG